MDPTANLEALIAAGKDSAALRFALASRYLAASDLEKAVEHAEAAVRLDPEYSAAWKLLGKILAESGRNEAAAETYRHGISVAEKRGDQQAAKEMRVFLKRLERAASP
ncbi:MAG TPA: tetratricopeptide repeat protein [Gammaproteobacteria bacterium]|nr:tetratricopeptide repeat protein [Gammaproteobacteria bacterium]